MPEIASFESIIIFIAWFGIMLWIFRPQNKISYDRYSRIPLDGADNNISIIATKGDTHNTLDHSKHLVDKVHQTKLVSF